ncbi:MAG: LytTR family transcriptional regulator DNA-binding domain-containing protein [Chitinophagales bacterium]|nr:LytTR family transcriptional regulator DNA-binding domain-containing protein [Chitinophagales bacterium]
MKLQFLLLPDDQEQNSGILYGLNNLHTTSTDDPEAVQLLLKNLTRLMADQTTNASPISNKDSGNLRLSVADGIVFIPLDEIRYVKADGPYAEIHYAKDKMVLIAKPLKEICSRLIHPSFMRVHQSYLCQLNWVEKIHRDGYLVLKTQEHIPVSRANWQQVIDALTALKNG